jgi:threonylcarbamoyladenosine tRNA methylthiotransferase MtaB
VAGLAAAGFEEVVLTAVHLGGYGTDLTPRTNLAELVEMLAELRLVPRLRLTSIDPHEVTERLVRVMAAAPDLCDHLHVPLQAGDDGVLRAMRRRYDTALARERLAMARELLPAAQLGTDLIAGFPGEDAPAHERTMRFVSESPLTYAHVFAYSPRQGTTAAKIGARPGPDVGRARAGDLRALVAGKGQAFLRGFDGALGEVLVERARDPRTGRLRGYTRNYTRVVFDGPGHLAGRRVLVRLAFGPGRVMAGEVAA